MIKHNPNEPYLVGCLIMAIITAIFNLITVISIVPKLLG